MWLFVVSLLFWSVLGKDALLQPITNPNPGLQGKAEPTTQEWLKGVPETDGNAWRTQETCKWIKLNTEFPLIWNCIWTSWTGINATNAFPVMITALTKIVMQVILVVCLILIIVWWIFIASDEKLGKGKELIKKVAIVILLLWFSSVILKLINPNFFGTS